MFFTTSISILVRLSKPPPLMTCSREINVQVNDTNFEQCNNELKSMIWLSIVVTSSQEIARYLELATIFRILLKTYLCKHSTIIQPKESL